MVLDSLNATFMFVLYLFIIFWFFAVSECGPLFLAMVVLFCVAVVFFASRC
jgi:hypothetical protein